MLQHHYKATFPHLQSTCDEVLKLIETKQLTIGPKKTELLVYRDGWKRPPLEGIPPRIGGRTIGESPQAKYLGIVLDRYLKFNPHITSRISPAVALAIKLKRLTNSASRVSPTGVRSIVNTATLPTMLYGAEAWYERTTYGVDKALDRCQCVLNQILRAALAIHQMTPPEAIHYESEVQSIRDYLTTNDLRVRVRLGLLSRGHPLRVVREALPLRKRQGYVGRYETIKYTFGEPTWPPREIIRSVQARTWRSKGPP